LNQLKVGFNWIHKQNYFNMDLKLFSTAFLQVFLVSANTLFIANLFYPGIAIAGFGISWFWTGNVKKISLSGKKDRLVYSVGAMIGGVCGVLFSNLIQNFEF